MKILTLLIVMMLTGTGNVLAQALSDSAIKTAITNTLRNRPPWEMIAGGAIGIPANVRAQSVTIVRRGPYNNQKGYWPIQATVSGTFDKKYHDGTSKYCTFAGTTDFQIYKNDYGDWLARATYAAETQLRPDCTGSGSGSSSTGIPSNSPLKASYILAPKHLDALRRWLNVHTEDRSLRLATPADLYKICLTCRSDVAEFKKKSGTNYHPFHMVGDFNKDGIDDFAVVVVDDRQFGEKCEKCATILVFNGPFPGRGPSFYQPKVNLYGSVLFALKDKPFLLIAPFASEGIELKPVWRDGHSLGYTTLR